jgi:HPt (histidine-containing phosphotransfer) domain-containing protein
VCLTRPHLTLTHAHTRFAQVAKATELSSLRKKNAQLQDQLNSLSGDVVPLAIVDKLKGDSKRRADELQAKVNELQSELEFTAAQVRAQQKQHFISCYFCVCGDKLKSSVVCSMLISFIPLHLNCVHKFVQLTD